MNTSQRGSRTLLLGITVVASGLLLAGCAAPVGASTTTSGGTSGGTSGSGAATTAGKAAAPSATGDAACNVVSASLISALVKVPVGKPYNELGSDPNDFACVYGIGSNASLTGSKIVTTNDDTLLVTRYGQLGASQYQHSVSLIPAGDVQTYFGLGDKAVWWNEFDQGPHLYTYKGTVGCEVSFILADGSEVGATPGNGMSDADAASVVKREAPICAALLG
jgi:hypothetical protein